jgi:glyoxylase-like metal-dependent hydrolase (beta-lactamase superfamily II)
MYLEAFADNPFDTNCWLLALEGSEDALVVDPGFFPERVHELLKAAGKRAVAALATHGHYDHIGSAALFCGSEIPFYIHKDDELALTDPRGWGAGFVTEGVGRPGDVRTVSDGEVIDVAGFSLEVLHTPGHTPGHICFKADEWIFTGDLVFKGAIGRSDFPNSDPEAMEASLRRFLALPDPLAVYPGHGPDTTVGFERRTNPFFRYLG